MRLDKQHRAELIIQLAEEIKAENILLYEVSEYSSITDFIIICEGRSQAHVKGISDKLDEQMRKKKIRAHIEGYGEGSWILMDYDEVIVHIFHPETRKYYNLEELYEKSSLASVEEVE
ncbi:ribosome silencing factor [Deltaproteobacteria bacterium TL4]